MTDQTSIETEPLRVTLFGVVHLPLCGEAPGMTWEWAGRNNLAGDRACSTCLPDGLPEHESYQFTPEEIERLRAVVSR